MNDICEKCGILKAYHDSGKYYNHTTGKMDGCRVTFPAMSTKPSPKASLYKTTGYHIQVDGEVFKSQGAAGYGGGDSTLSDKHRREVATLIARAVNNREQMVKALKHCVMGLRGMEDVCEVIEIAEKALSELEQG